MRVHKKSRRRAASLFFFFDVWYHKGVLIYKSIHRMTVTT
nr:hypothetical protein XZYIHYVE_XZYIHYVE_CDS_0006 [Microvirus sp.]